MNVEAFEDVEEGVVFWAVVEGVVEEVIVDECSDESKLRHAALQLYSCLCGFGHGEIAVGAEAVRIFGNLGMDFIVDFADYIWVWKQVRLWILSYDLSGLSVSYETTS